MIKFYNRILHNSQHIKNKLNIEDRCDIQKEYIKNNNIIDFPLKENDQNRSNSIGKRTYGKDKNILDKSKNHVESLFKHHYSNSKNDQGTEESKSKLFYNYCHRFDQPKLSLLGRPLANNKLGKNDFKYRRFQTGIYNFLERPRGWKQLSYHLILFIAVFICLVLSVFATVPQYEKFTGEILFYMEVVMVSWFIIELIARIWSSGCRSRYMHLIGRLRFMIRPFTLLDFIVIIASLIVLLLGSTGQVFAASALRSLRFFQILRMVRMDRRGGTWKLLGSVVWAHRQELITTLYIGFLGLILSSFLVYLVEKNENPQKFGTYADALWWGVVTLCTVGYGDAVPITWSGKLIASFCALMGISFFALPAGILGSGFALKVQQQQRQKHLNRRRVPAAILIQSLWRCYAADIKSTSEATWKIFYNANSYSPTPYFPAPSIFKHNTSFVSRFSSRKYRSTVQMSNPVTSPVSKKVNIYTSIASNGVDDIMHHLNLTSSSETLNIKNPNENEIVPIQIKLDDVHKDAIRCLRKIKYFVARRKFREALKPYDVKDVLEQYAAGHIDLISRVKILQHRFDMILGQQETKNKDVYISNYSLASRIVNIERQVDDIEHKIDTLIDMHRSQTIEKKLMLNADINIEIDNEKDTLSLYSGKQIKCEKYETSDHFSKNKLPEHDQRINTESLNMKTHGIMNYSHHSNNASLNRDHPLHFAEDDEKKNFKEDIDGESYSFRNFQTNQKKKEKKRHKKNKKFLLKDISEESSI